MLVDCLLKFVLLSNWVNYALVNSNFQLDVSSYTLNFNCTFEISNKIPISKGKFSQIFNFKFQLDQFFNVSHLSLKMLKCPKLNFKDSLETW